MSNKAIAILLSLSLTIAGCATSSKNISTTYVSPMQFQAYDCDQLAMETMRISTRVNQLGGRLDAAAANDKMITGAGVILFWPALFALGGTKEQEAEYARLKGEYDAIQQASVLKKCMTPQEKVIQQTPVCNDEKDCTAKWEAAQLWVVHNSAYKLQTTTNVLLETYNSPAGETKLAVRVTKEPIGGGKYKIIANAWCGSSSACTPNELEATMDFNKKIGAVVP